MGILIVLFLAWVRNQVFPRLVIELGRSAEIASHAQITRRFLFSSIASALVVGLINGLAVTRLKMNPLMTTLGTWWIAQGIAFGVTQGEARPGANSCRRVKPARRRRETGEPPGSLVDEVDRPAIHVTIARGTGLLVERHRRNAAGPDVPAPVAEGNEGRELVYQRTEPSRTDEFGSPGESLDLDRRRVVDPQRADRATRPD